MSLTPHMPVLETDHLILRAPEPRDEQAYVAFYGSARRAATGVLVPPAIAAQRFQGVLQHWADKGYGRFIVQEKSDDTPVGLIGPHHPDDYPEQELSWHIWNDTAEGKGIAYEAARAARDYAFGVLLWDTAVSYVRPDNVRSAALAQKLGATLDELAPYPEAIDLHLVYRHPKPEAQQ